MVRGKRDKMQGGGGIRVKRKRRIRGEKEAH